MPKMEGDWMYYHNPARVNLPADKVVEMRTHVG